MQVTIEELAMMIGQKEIQIYSLEKQLIAAHQRIAELEKQKAAEPSPA